MDTLRMGVSKARILKFFGALFVVCAALFFAANPAWATMITVNSTDDTAANDGECTLREAVASANTDTASGSGCAAGGGADEIVFSLPGGPNTITLGGTQLSITSNLDIAGPGADSLTVNGGGGSRVFEITSGAVEIRGLTITGGRAVGSGTENLGGGIYNSGSLTLDESVVSDNVGNNGGGSTTTPPET